MITVEEALYLVDNAIKPERLNSVQELILTQCWSGSTYQEIAEASGYDSDYVRVVGSRLWQLLSQVFGEKITKNNFRSILRQQVGRITESTTPTGTNITALELPSTPVPLDSALYISRPPVESLAYEEIVKPGALITIKGPKQMGKTSLAMRIAAQARSRGYHTVRLNLFQAEDSVVSNLERLLRWFCTNISLQLGIESSLSDYWDEDLGYKVSCTNYLQGHILSQLQNPLVITLDEIHRLFNYPQITREFLPLLRFWHEEGNNIPVWQKLRLVVTHCTEMYIQMDIHQSPFNVGLPLELHKFNREQVMELARRYGLDRSQPAIDPEQIETLAQIVGGHPYLSDLAFYHLKVRNADISRIIGEAATDTGIYRDHLRSHLVTLKRYPQLATAYQQVVRSSEPVTLDTIVAYKLESMGLVELRENQTVPRCELYRLYFSDRLK